MKEQISFEADPSEIGWEGQVPSQHGRWFRQNDRIFLSLNDESLPGEQELGGGRKSPTGTGSDGWGATLGLVANALRRGLWAVAIGMAIQRGVRDENRLTDMVFTARHPDRRGQRLQPGEQQLRREWLDIRDRLVRPALRASSSVNAPVVPAAAHPLVWPTSPFPPAEASRFINALSKLETRVKSTPDPRNSRYQCWFPKLRNSSVDDRVIRWSKICPATTGALGAAFVVGPCDISMGFPVAQQKIENSIRSVADVDSVGQSLGIITYLKSDIVVSEEMTSLPLENLRMLHDDVQVAIDKLRKWSDSPMGGSSAMPRAYVSIKDWIGGRQRDSKSVYSCL